MSRYRIMVDDNFHHMDESYRFELDVVATVEEAVAICKRMVDRDLAHMIEPFITADQLFYMYKAFGSDPFVLPVDDHAPRVGFSSWGYAEEQCKVLCARGWARVRLGELRRWLDWGGAKPSP